MFRVFTILLILVALFWPAKVLAHEAPKFSTGALIVHLTTKLRQPITQGQAPLMVLDRNAAFLCLPHDQRGGSTHGWTRPMSTATARGQRLVFDQKVSYALIDPQVNQNHPVHAPKTVILSAIGGSTWKDRQDLWKVTPEQLGRNQSYSALLKAGDSLYVGGGQRDGSGGFVQIAAANGKLRFM